MEKGNSKRSGISKMYYHKINSIILTSPKPQTQERLLSWTVVADGRMIVLLLLLTWVSCEGAKVAVHDLLSLALSPAALLGVPGLRPPGPDNNQTVTHGDLSHALGTMLYHRYSLCLLYLYKKRVSFTFVCVPIASSPLFLTILKI